MSKETRVRHLKGFSLENTDNQYSIDPCSPKDNHKPLINIAVLASFLLVLLYAVAYYFSTGEQKENTRLLAETFLERTDRTLYIWIEGDINVIRDIAEDPIIIEALQHPEDAELRLKARLVIEDIQNRRGYYSTIALTPIITDGKALITEKSGHSYKVTDGMVFLDSSGGSTVGTTILDYKYGRALISGDVSTHIGTAELNLPPGNPPFFIIASRVEKDGKLLGIATLEINLDAFSMKFLGNPGLGPNTKVFIVDNRGYILAGSKPSKMMNETYRQEMQSLINKALQTPMQFVASTIQGELSKEAMIMELNRSNLATYETSWYLLLVKGKREAFGDTLNVLGKIFVFTTVLSILIIASTVFILGKIFIRKLNTEKNNAESSRRELERLYYTDLLTELPNKPFLNLKLEEYTRAENFAIGSFDIDGLKSVNDMLGHTDGDALILRGASLLRRISTKGGMLFRMGGDGFVGLYPNCGENEISFMEERLEAALIVERTASKEAPPLRISYGFALKRTPEDSIEAVLKKANGSMYRLKRINSESVRNELFARLERDESRRSLALQSIISRYTENYPDFTPYKKNTLLLIKYKDIGKMSTDSYPMENMDAPDENAASLFFAERGFRIASLFPQIYDIARFILRQHERWDGKGEVFGKDGDLPIECRVLAVAETYLTAQEETLAENGDSVYARQKAMELIQNRAGTLLDPKIVERFIAMF